MPEQNWLVGVQLDHRTLRAWQKRVEQRLEQIRARQWDTQSVLLEERAIRQELAWRRAHQRGPDT